MTWFGSAFWRRKSSYKKQRSWELLKSCAMQIPTHNHRSLGFHPPLCQHAIHAASSSASTQHHFHLPRICGNCPCFAKSNWRPLELRTDHVEKKKKKKKTYQLKAAYRFWEYWQVLTCSTSWRQILFWITVTGTRPISLLVNSNYFEVLTS